MFRDPTTRQCVAGAKGIDWVSGKQGFETALVHSTGFPPMSKPQNRLQLMERFGATQLNDRWSWCAVNEAKREVFFSIWTDKVIMDAADTRYVLQEPHWGLNDATGMSKAARHDQDNKFALVFDQGYAAFGYFVVAKDTTAIPREIAETRTGFVMRMNLSKDAQGVIVGAPVERIEVR